MTTNVGSATDPKKDLGNVFVLVTSTYHLANSTRVLRLVLK